MSPAESKSSDANPPLLVPAASTGISGLDEILKGGLPTGFLYLISGNAGSGKTTLSLQFLMEGRARGERVLYVTLSETLKEIQAVARSHGWTLDGIHLEQLPVDQRGADEDEQTVFKAAEVELGEFRARLESIVETANPARVVIDSLSELRLLSGDPRQHRRQMVALKRFFGTRGCTVIITDDNTSPDPNHTFHSLMHGVVALTRATRAFGGARRRIEVVKVRGLAFDDGLHDYAIRTGGLVVYPRLIVAESRGPLLSGLVLSGLPALDRLLGGGIHRGTSVALIGPSGIGKSMTALQYVLHNLKLGKKASIFLFDESLRTLQLNAVGSSLAPHIADGALTVHYIDPAEVSPGEFTARVRVSVESGTELVVIDGLNGYVSAMPDEQLLVLHLHKLLVYLNASNVTTFLIASQRGAILPAVDDPLDVSHLTDTVILYRNYEHRGEVGRAITVLKHRGAELERTLRPLTLPAHGMAIGEPLRGLRGVLTGTPISTERNEPSEQ